MNKTQAPLRRYYATDKEVFDVLMASKQRLSAATLHQMAISRGVFFPAGATREELSDELSLLPTDWFTLERIVIQTESGSRAEKVTSIILNDTLSMADVVEVCKEYASTSPSDEKVTNSRDGGSKLVMRVEYTELDFSRTTLLQRKQKEAAIEVVVAPGSTTIRMPANAKATTIVNVVKERLEGKLKKPITTEKVDLSEFATPDERTEFFTTLITTLEGFELKDVTSVKVQSHLKQEDAESTDMEDADDQEELATPISDQLDDDTNEEDQTPEVDEETAEAEDEMLSIVEDVALHGQILLASEEYQQLKQKGFFISSVVWRSQKQTGPFDIYEFEAGFDEPEIGRSFKYNTRGLFKVRDGVVLKTPRVLSEDQRDSSLSVLENAAASALNSLRNKHGENQSQVAVGDASKGGAE